MRTPLMFLGLACLAVGLTNATAYADPPKGGDVCIRTKDIDHMAYPNDRTILFHMKSGSVKVWRNEFREDCRDMAFEQRGGKNPHQWSEELCANQMFLMRRGYKTCVLGDFTPEE